MFEALSRQRQERISSVESFDDLIHRLADRSPGGTPEQLPGSIVQPDQGASTTPPVVGHNQVSVQGHSGISYLHYVRGDVPQTDAQLLADLQRAVQETGLQVRITAAFDGEGNHHSSSSRHSRGKALDIDSIGPPGHLVKITPGNPYVAQMVNWFVSHGYALNSERGGRPAVIWNVEGHHTHFHISQP